MMRFMQGPLVLWEFSLVETPATIAALKNANGDPLPLAIEGDIVVGWGLISRADDKAFFNSAGTNVDEDVLVQAVSKFMQGERIAKFDHGKPIGKILAAFPLTSVVAEVLDIDTRGRSGVAIMMQVDDPDVMKAITEGKLRGFSPRFSGDSRVYP